MKISISFYTTLALLACTLPATSPVEAQPTLNASEVEAPLVDTPLDIDPQAKKALDDLTVRYMGLHSYSDVTVTDRQTEGVQLSVETAWERPGKACVVRKEGDKVWQGVSDGRTLWASTPEYPNAYLQCRAWTRQSPASEANSKVGVYGLGYGDPGGGYSCEFLLKHGLRVLRFQGEPTVDGILTRLVTAKLEPADGSTDIITYYIGVEDGVLHRIAADFGGRKVVETHTDIHLNPQLAPDTWHFSPPTGSKAFDEEEYRQLKYRRYVFRYNYKVGDHLPLFEANDLKGEKVALADLLAANQVVLLCFFGGTNCDVSGLKNLLARYQAQGLAVVGVSFDKRRSAVERFVAEKQIPFPIVFDGQGWENAVATKYGVHGIPSYLFVGRDGRLLSTDAYRSPGNPEFGKFMAEALATPMLH